MSTEEASLVKKIFGAALEVPPDELEGFLDRACGADSSVKAEVLSLLRAHRVAGEFLNPNDRNISAGSPDFGSESDLNITGLNPQTLDHFRLLMLEEQPGGTIDRYKLLDVIGEGGYGIVFRARQEHPVRRIVALKVIKKGMESTAVRSRFEAERQTLALMDHPNIAKLYDAGTTEQGRPYFVMELVKGVPITRFCDERRLSIRERIELLITVCRAIHHAHQKGILHQDLKPSNILVAESGDGTSPKVIDFGVSRLMADPQGNDQILGTPQYMSPEQLSVDKPNVDTRSDVYSLGTVLYEILTGTPVYELENGVHLTILEIRDRLKDQPVEPPGDRVASLASSSMGTGDPAQIAHNRQATWGSLAASLKEDLDWIVMKAIHHNRASRYDSVAALADDLQRHLDHRPVLAAPASLSYLCRRFCVRNKTVVILSTMIAVALVASLLAVSILFIRARDSRDRAVTAEQVAAESKAQAIAKLKQSYLDQARAGQRSRWPGQRINSLRAIAQAAQIAPALELRNEAIASMSLPDVELVQRWPVVDSSDRMGFTDQMDSYAVSDPQGTISIRRASDNSLVYELPGFGRPVNDSFRFSPDGEFLAVDYTPGKGALQVWDLKTRLPIFQLDMPRRVDFTHDSKSFAVGTSSELLELRSLPSGQLTKSIPAGEGVDRMSFQPGDQKIVVSGEKGVRLVPLNGNLLTPILPQADYVTAMAWHPDGEQLAIADLDSMNRIQVLNVNTGTLQSILKGHVCASVDLAFTHDGRFLLSGGWDGRVRLWDTAGGTELLTFEGFGGDLQVVRDDSQVCFASSTGHQMWRLIEGDECRVARSTIEDTHVWSTDFTPDNRLLAGATCEGVRLWDIQTGNIVGFVSCPGPRTVLFDRTGANLFASTTSGVKHWMLTDLIGHRDRMEAPVTETRTPAVAMNRDQTIIVFGNADGTLLVGNPDKLTDAKPLGRHSLPPRYIAVSPDGTWAASSVRRFDNTLTFKVWNLITRSLAVELPISPGMTELGQAAFSPDGKTLITADHLAYRWYSVGNWKLIHQLDRHDSTIAGNIAFSPDGKLLALTGHGYSILLADPTTGQEFATIDTQIPHLPDFIQFSPDSSQLVVTGATVMIWNLPSIRHELASMQLNW